MPVSAKLFKLEKFPSKWPIETTPASGAGMGDLKLLTKVEALGRGEYKEKNLEKVMITHDKAERFSGVGYSETFGRIEDLIGIANESEFPAFIMPEKDYLFAAYSSKEMFNQAFRRLNQHTNIYDADAKDKELRAKPVKIDLQKVKDSFTKGTDSPKIQGGWFKNLQITNVDVAYIGGGNVDDSDEWTKYETSGKISALRLDYPNADIEGEPLRILLTSDGTVFNYKNFSEKDLLALVVPIFEYVIEFIES